MDRRNDPDLPFPRRIRPVTALPPSDTRSEAEGERPSLATPFAWLGGGLLLTGTTFLVSMIALIRAFVALFR
jgi:hypothetical protein